MNLEEKYRRQLKIREDREEHMGVIIGTCMTFCPEFERLERTLRHDISTYENSLMFKKFSRSAAGKLKEFPEDVRPLSVLIEATTKLLSLCYNDYSIDLYKFVSNRSRSIRLDISIQNLVCPGAMGILERIARFHIIYGYCLYDDHRFEEYLNIEQLRKILSTIHEMHNKGVLSNNYKEFVCYTILLNIEDKEYSLYDFEYKHDDAISHCLQIKRAYQQKDAYTFFELARNLDFLKYCVVQTHFDKIRSNSFYIFKRCFVEFIDGNFFKKTLDLCNEELVSLVDLSGLKLNNGLVNFKDKKSEEREGRLIKKRKPDFLVTNPAVYIYLGAADAFILESLTFEYIQKLFSGDNPGYSEKKKNVIETKQIPKVAHQDNSEACKDLCIEILDTFITQKTLETYCDLIMSKEVGKTIRMWRDKLKSKNTEASDIIAIVTDDNLFSAVFKQKIKESKVMDLNPSFFTTKEATVELLLRFNFTVFCVKKSSIEEFNKKYYMLNRIVDCGQGLLKQIDGIIVEAKKSSKLFKVGLSRILRGKSYKEKVLVVTEVLRNEHNSVLHGTAVDRIIRDVNVRDINVYIDSDEKKKFLD